MQFPHHHLLLLVLALATTTPLLPAHALPAPNNTGTSTPPPAAPVCTSGGFTIPTATDTGKAVLTNWTGAAGRCGGLGGGAAVAGSTTGTSDQIAGLLDSCGGLTRAWIASWNSDTYGGNPLYTMKRTDGVAGAGVYVDLTGAMEIAVVCAKW
ncbi:hypothetical protein DFJ73DRAFT_765125 [Zopfochytrium polystomum]|nr:hypothetical protein DFJ73DRAFT_765125 [Zopfochytrium polystomum]